MPGQLSVEQITSKINEYDSLRCQNGTFHF